MVAYGAVFTGASLADGEVDDLTAYVESLPADLLYVNSATPLDGATSVYFETPIEVVFSANLAPGQEDFFGFVDGEGEPVEGAWTLSGRYARFEPVAALDLDTSYRIEVEAGVAGELGSCMPEPVTIEFETGGVPRTDISGTWTWRITNPIPANLTVAFIQSPGGHVSGTVLRASDNIDFDHVEGHITDLSLHLEPFQATSSFIGEILVQQTTAEMEDTDGDGYADRGDGEANAGLRLSFVLIRESLPASVGD